VFYSSPDTISDLLAKIQDKNTVSTSIPSFDGFDNTLASYLPDNFITYSDDQPQSINQTNMENVFQQNATAIRPTLDSSATSYLNSVQGQNSINVQNSIAISQLESANSQLTKTLESYSKGISMQTIGTLKGNDQAFQLGNLNQSVQSSYPSFTPKGIRDLSNPDIFNAKKQETVTTALDNLKNNSKEMTLSEVQNNDFNNSAQQNLQQISSPQYSGDNKNGFDLYVRRTVYWAYGSGTDSDSAALRSSTGRQLQQGISAAVDPAIIPYLSRIQFPDIGVRFATDTGGAVKARTASGGKTPVVDVFFFKKEDAIAFANSTPEYISVKVFPPTSNYRYAKNSPPTYGIA